MRFRPASILLPLALLACSTPEKGETQAETAAAVEEVRLPEVRYYVIADT